MVLNTCAEQIVLGLCTLYLLTGEIGNITPTFKKGDRDLAKNYRPVSLTSVSCKVLEHIV